MTASPGRVESFSRGGSPPTRPGRRPAARATMLIVVVVAVVLTTVGVVPASAATSGGWSSLGNGGGPTIPALNDRVYAILPVGQKLYFGGQFTNAGGVGAGDRAAIWDGTSWSAIGAGLTNGTAYALAVRGSTVFAGGAFTDAGGHAQADNLAMWNGSSWVAVGNTSIDGPVFALKIVGSTLYIGGGFDNVHGIGDADGIVAYDIDANTWSAITPQNEALVGTVSSIVQSDDGGLYVGSSGTDMAGIDAADFLARYDLTSHGWSAVGPPAPGVSAINNRVRGLFADGPDVYTVGDFTNAAGIQTADKVAKWDGAQWSAVGDDGAGGGFFGEAQAVSLYSVLATDGKVFVGGNFLNAGGKPLIDVIAGFRGNKWTNVGTNADGTNGPGGGTVFALAASSNKLYAGTLDTAFGGSTQNSHGAFLRLRQPDERIAIGQGAPVGDDRYNTSGIGQEKTVKTAAGTTVMFTIGVQNDGFSPDSLVIRGGGSVSGFTVRYLSGATDVTAGVVAGTFTFANVSPGSRKKLTLKITVGNGVSSGSGYSSTVTASSQGASPPAKDVVNATVIVK
jgi:hypothetical protein